MKDLENPQYLFSACIETFKGYDLYVVEWAKEAMTPGISKPFHAAVLHGDICLKSAPGSANHWGEFKKFKQYVESST